MIDTSVRISHYRAPANRWTFTIPPIERLLARYVANGLGWVDPFAGMSSPAEYTNDLADKTNARWHMDALEFCKIIRKFSGSGTPFEGVLFDPPYSYRQISDCYKENGLKASSLDTSENFYNRVMNAICDQVKPGGYAISFGWNTNGFGFNRSFVPIEYMVIAHGGHRYDTLVTVEQRMDIPSAKWRESDAVTEA